MGMGRIFYGDVGAWIKGDMQPRGRGKIRIE
jgi:hypothetical protein